MKSWVEFSILRLVKVFRTR